MAADIATPIDARLYRAALHLCPGEFRRDHGGEMICDFDDARSEAAGAGAKAVWGFRLLVYADLGRTLVVQWLRTGLPLIGGTAAIISLLLGNAAASIARRITIRVPDDATDEGAALVLLGTVAVLVIVTTIVLNFWLLARPRRHVRRR